MSTKIGQIPAHKKMVESLQLHLQNGGDSGCGKWTDVTTTSNEIIRRKP